MFLPANFTYLNIGTVKDKGFELGVDVGALDAVVCMNEGVMHDDGGDSAIQSLHEPRREEAP